MVTSRHIRHLALALTTLRAVLVLAAAAMLIRILWPAAELEKPPSGVVVANVGDGADPQIRHDLDWYAPLWQRDLKQPPSPDAPPEETPSRGPTPRLVATFVETNQRWAHLIGSDGRIVMRTLEDPIDRFVLASIEPGRVQLRFDEGRFWVEIPNR